MIVAGILLLAKDFLTVAIFLIVGIAFVVIALLLSLVFRPHRPGDEKLSTYECGEEPIGPAWLQFRVGYYIYALIFLIFDVEAVFLFPWALVFRPLGTSGFVEMLLFIAVLGVGLLYAWRKGALEWA